ncbi:MAG: amidohydrolase family protein [Thermotogae bacterium]|nr:amidohydrolase family protein [Thermotogota bacterium]
MAKDTQDFDLVIRHARLRDGRLLDIGIKDGKIAAMKEGISGKTGEEIDATGNLVTESFVNPHLHLCKVYTLRMMDELALQDYHGEKMGRAMSAIELAARIKERYDESWILPNVRKALELAVKYGNTHIRAFADVDTKAKLEGVKALLKAKEEFKGIVELQVVAFAQDGIVREPGAEKLLKKAMELGADVVGGIPWIEYTVEDMQRHVKTIFDIAQTFDKDVSMLVDDAGDPTLKTLEMMAVEAIKRGWQGRVLAHHARAMALYPDPYFLKLAALLKKARLPVVSDPHTGPLHARVKDLIREGVLVCLGQDDITDAYYPYGRNNMLEVAFLASHVLWMTSKREMEKLYDMVTTDAARAMGLKTHLLKEENPANLVIVKGEDVLEALRFHEEPLAVISHGKLVKEKPMVRHLS